MVFNKFAYEEMEKIIENNNNHRKRYKLRVAATIGPYRSGKSLLQNGIRSDGSLDGFDVGNQV